jgi:hypothetical protein
MAPTTYTFKQHGKPVTEEAVWTMVFQKAGTDWPVAGWAWAQH